MIKIDEETKGCFAKAAIDEPLFILRAQDKLAPLVVQMWALLAKENNVGKRKISEAYALAEEMRRWASVHGAKIPD